MSEAVSLTVTLLFVVLGGTAATVILGKKKRFHGGTDTIFMWLFHCYFEFLMINGFRVLLLQGSRILSYSDDIFLLFFDILLLAAGILFLYYGNQYRPENDNKAKYFIGILLLCYVILFISAYLQYHNINAAIYSLLQPKKNLYIGILAIACRILSYRSCQGIRKTGLGTQEAVVSLFVVTMLISPVVETYLTNTKEFSFSFRQIWYKYFICIALIWIGISIIYVLLQGKVKEICLFLLWSFSVCAYFQGMFFNSRLFLMEGKASDWNFGTKFANLMIWCVLFLILRVFYGKLRENGRKLLLYSSLALCIMQLAGAISLIPNGINQGNKNEIASNYLSEKGLYEAAKKDNIIIFVLDTYDVDFLQEVLEERPEFLQPLKGFTYFPDTVSQFSRTFPSIPYMLTEEVYFYEQPLNQYVDSAFEKCSFWKQINEKGYQMYFYEEDEDHIGETVRRAAANFVEEGHLIHEKISFSGCMEAAVRIGNYRLLPYALKEYYSYTSGTINDMVVEKREWDFPAFVSDDAEVYRKFQEEGIRIAQEDKALRFIHLNGAHAPYTMTEDGTRAEKEMGTAIGQYIGSMNLVYDYIKELQRLGLYEQSTIIITADHGENYVAEELEQNTNPILFIKPSGEGTEKEMQVSDIYASQNDLLPTISALYDMDYDESWGLDLFSAKGKDKERTRYHYYAVVENGLQTKTRTYEIKGSSLDFDNWHATDEYHEFGEYY